MAEWRECAFGSRPYATMTRRIRHLHYDYTRGERYRRRCKWRDEVCERDCARCPVPALVEAVEAGASKLPSCAMIREGKEWSFRSVVEVREQCEAALAAVKKGA